MYLCIMENKAVNFISLGPGSSGYVTTQVVRTLLNADKIYCFAVNGKSRAAETIAETGIESSRIITIDIMMNADRSAAMKVYDHTAYDIEKDWQEGLSVSVATEGDTGIYATTHYVMDRLAERNVPVYQMPGIPSFIAAASIAGLHLVKLNERLLVIPGHVTEKDIVQHIENNTNIVIMKLSIATEAVHKCMLHHPEYHYHYFENVGSTGQDAEKYLTDINQLIQIQYPYFSLMIIQKRKI